MSSGESRHARWFRVLAYVTVFTVMTSIAWCIAYARWRSGVIANIRKNRGEIYFTPLPEFLPEWVAMPEWLQGIDSISLKTCGTTDDSLSSFAGFPLTEISPYYGFGPCGSPELSDAGLKNLAGTPLERLVLTESRITGSGFAHLRECPLRTVFISDSKINDSGVAELARISTLEAIGLGGSEITDAALAELKKLPGLKHLHLSWTDVTDEGLKHLTGLKLESLSLSCTYVTDKGLQHLKQMPLRNLGLLQTEVTPQGLRALIGMKSLEEVVVFHSKFTAEAVAELNSEGLNVIHHNYGGMIPSCERVSWIDWKEWRKKRLNSAEEPISPELVGMDE